MAKFVKKRTPVINDRNSLTDDIKNAESLSSFNTVYKRTVPEPDIVSKFQ